MGRLIDVDKFLKKVKKDREHEIYLHSWTADMVLERLDSWYAPPVEAIPKADYENRLKADMAGMLNELQYDLYHGLCKEIHGKEDCPCTNQTTSCLATFRVCDANRAIDKVIQQKINSLKENIDGK